MHATKWILGLMALWMVTGCYYGPRRAYYGRPGYARPVYVAPAPVYARPVYVAPGPVYARPR